MELWTIFLIVIIASIAANFPRFEASKQASVTEFDWANWWSYDGISGPGFWGVINRHWRLCSDGKRQSPVDLSTSALVFDHTLEEVSIDSNEVDGRLENTGFGLQWRPSPETSLSLSSSGSSHTTGDASSPSLLQQPKNRFLISGGPLHYRYSLSHAVIRWSTSEKGSEHKLQGQAFPAEVQLHFYNNELYSNFTNALDKPNGIAAVAIFLKVGWSSNTVLKIILDRLHMVPHRGKSTFIPFVPVRELFTTKFYLTYEGSLTEPSCEETVTWLILNKPAYITADQLWQLQSLRRSSQGQSSPSAGNVRPIQPLFNRVIRTNIPPHEMSCPKTNRTSLYQASQDIGTL